MKPRRRLSAHFSFATAIAALFACQSAQAQTTYFWDQNDTATGFGAATGTWQTGTISRWSSGTGASAGTATPGASVTTTTSDPVNFGTDNTGGGLATGSVIVDGTVEAASIKFGNQTIAAVTLDGGTINLAATTSINVGAGSTTHTITSQITGAATSLTKSGPGLLRLSGSNSYTGETIISGGTLILNNATALGGSNLGVNGTSSISMAAGTTLRSDYIILDTGNVDSFIYAPITLTAAGTNNFLIGAGNSAPPAEAVTFNLNGAIGGTAGANVVFGNTTASRNNADSIIVLGAASTYDGNTTIQAGATANRITVKAGVANALPTTTVLSFDSVAGSGSGRTSQFDLNGNNQTLAGLSNAGVVAADRNLRVTSASAATLTINNTTTNYTFGGSTLETSNSSPFNTTTSAQIAGAISLVKSGSGTFTLGGTLTGGAAALGNTFTGSTKILGGILELGQTNSIQNSAFDTDGSALGGAGVGLRSSVTSLRIGGLTGGNDFATRFTTAGGYTGLTTLILNPVNGATHTYSGDIGDGAGAMNLSKANEGTQVLSATNSYTGITTILRGTLRINSIDDYSAPSSIGSAASGDLVIGSANTGVLDYVGSGDSSNRTITVGSSIPAEAGGAFILANGGAALTFNATTFNTARTGATAARTLTLGGAGIGAIDGKIQDNNTAGGGTVAVTKQDSGTWTLSGQNDYTGATTVSGGSLIINGAVASTSVVVNASLGGSGVMANATLSGLGSINPGSSPGVLTAAAVDPTGGLNFNFEFTAANTLPTWNAPTASGNDVLRLSGASPFTAALDGSNTVALYFNVGSLNVGDVFTGGFYTDNNAEFLSTIANADFEYFLADTNGKIPYGGNTYSVYNGFLELATVSQSADFGAGAVTGYTMQFTVVPEPSAAALLGGLGALALLRRRR